MVDEGIFEAEVCKLAKTCAYKKRAHARARDVRFYQVACYLSECSASIFLTYVIVGNRFMHKPSSTSSQLLPIARLFSYYFEPLFISYTLSIYSLQWFQFSLCQAKFDRLHNACFHQKRTFRDKCLYLCYQL